MSRLAASSGPSDGRVWRKHLVRRGDGGRRGGARARRRHGDPGTWPRPPRTRDTADSPVPDAPSSRPSRRSAVLRPAVGRGSVAGHLGATLAGLAVAGTHPARVLAAALPARPARRPCSRHVSRSARGTVATRRYLALLRSRAPSGAHARLSARDRRLEPRLPAGSRAGSRRHRSEVPLLDLGRRARPRRRRGSPRCPVHRGGVRGEDRVGSFEHRRRCRFLRSCRCRRPCALPSRPGPFGPCSQVARRIAPERSAGPIGPDRYWHARA